MNMVRAAATSSAHGVSTAPGFTITTIVFFCALATAETMALSASLNARVRRSLPSELVVEMKTTATSAAAAAAAAPAPVAVVTPLTPPGGEGAMVWQEPEE